ncbi:MAG: hypothetical protein AAF412_14305, partial [Pseudomonadota bacterium]
PPAEIPRSLALAFNEKQNRDQSVFDKILKRTSNNPFLKPENKPLLTTASIKANATEGQLSIMQPQPVAVTPSPTVETPQESQITVPQAAPQENEGQEFNPISAEISGASGVAETSAAPQSIAIPRRASRNTPGS